MDTRRRRVAVAAIVALVIALLYLSLSSRPQSELDSGYRLVMGTFARIVAVAPNSATAEKCLESALAEIDKVDALMSDYKTDSEISRVNRDAFGLTVKVSQPTFEVLRRSVEFSRLSDGAFDITIGPLVDLWRAAAEANSAPSEAELLAARSKVGTDRLILDANALTVRFTVEGMRLDLGAIAKGYAIDKAVEAMQRAGAAGGMVDIGGDLRCFGRPRTGRTHWFIGLQDPNDVRDDIGAGKTRLVLKLRDAGVATSGPYRRFSLVEGKKHSHIIDPKTGQSSDSLMSVTIIAPDALTADALATAVSVMGPEKGLALIETIAQTEAILIPSQDLQKLIKTPGVEKYLR